MHLAQIEMTSFEELRSFLHESDKGRVFDSLIAVELGLETYETFWQAHNDMSEGLTFEELVVGFLTDIYEYIGDGTDIEELVSSVADD